MTGSWAHKAHLLYACGKQKPACPFWSHRKVNAVNATLQKCQSIERSAPQPAMHRARQEKLPNWPPNSLNRNPIEHPWEAPSHTTQRIYNQQSGARQHSGQLHQRPYGATLWEARAFFPWWHTGNPKPRWLLIMLRLVYIYEMMCHIYTGT